MFASPTDGIGKRLANYRRLAGMSAQQLSDALGGEMSRGVIANIESGRKTDVTVDQMIALAWVLDVPFVALALPIDRPFEWFTLVRGTGPKSWQSMRSAELLRWMTVTPEPFRVDRAVGVKPAGVVARATLRALSEYHQLSNEVNSLRMKVEQDPEYQDVLDERINEFNRVGATLLELGVDLSVPDED